MEFSGMTSIIAPNRMRFPTGLSPEPRLYRDGLAEMLVSDR